MYLDLMSLMYESIQMGLGYISLFSYFLSRGQVRCTVEGAAMRSTVVFHRLSTVRQWNQQAGSRTGRSSKSYKNRSGIGYITILWQNLGSASPVTLSGSPRRPGHLQRSLQPSATGPWLLQLLQHCVGHPGRHNACLQASAVTSSCPYSLILILLEWRIL
jgi:hypothetical protein